MGLTRFVRLGLCALVLALGPLDRAQALPPETVQSVVSVLPVWAGRAQGGTGGPPGVAPEGSGVVLGDGVIATAWHVIEPARRIDVRLHDGRILPAELIGHDAASDIALLQVDAPLPRFEMAADPALADPVCSVGNAFGLGLSVTCGVVSALQVSNAGFNSVEDFVQTDAAINPGSSGGALVDADGRLVGMVSAIFASESDTNTGVSFAVSAALLTRVAEALLATGEVRYPAPGWRLETGSRAQLARVAAPAVRSVQAGGAADLAGLQPGDLILQIGARRVQDPRDAVAALAILPNDATRVTVVFERQGNRQDVVLVLQSPDAEAAVQPADLLGDCPHPQPVCVMRQAVFPVSSYDPVASATRIGPNLLVTNRHVVGDRSDAVVHTSAGPRGARVVPSIYPGDLVLLEVDGLPEGGHIPDLAGDALTTPMVFAVGADLARQEVRVFDPGALIAGPVPEAELGRLHVTAQMQPGVSGGALVDADGELVGIAVGGGDGRFEAIPLADIRALLEGRAD
ncbi:MAG: trypsin-like peptidase domain-containing protein [Paracoccaceae bacterium]|nr:trypsin-like peptidase domain-containing protein [Paracoccaceae bacterium]